MFFIHISKLSRKNILFYESHHPTTTTGVKKSLEMYKINGEMLTDIVLCVSNFQKDVQISRLSEDDFEEV